jgi:hypothetical protein
MEALDFLQFSGINSIYSLIGMLIIYFATEIFKWYRKRHLSGRSKENIFAALKRLELLNMIQHSPEEKHIITNLYAEYKSLGGNSYIDLQYQRWLKETFLVQALDISVQRLD